MKIIVVGGQLPRLLELVARDEEGQTVGHAMAYKVDGKGKPSLNLQGTLPGDAIAEASAIIRGFADKAGLPLARPVSVLCTTAV